jgi:hypothetical protein
VKFCVTQINAFLSAIKEVLPDDRWTSDRKVKGRMLTTTALNGLINCLRLLVQNDKVLSFGGYVALLKPADLTKFDFASYKSSQYRRLGEALFKKYFE